MIICKTKWQLEAMREAGRIVARVLAHLKQLIEPGVTTLQLDREAERIIRKAGAIPTFKGYMGYPATLCTSINEEVVHGIPSQRELKEGDIISLDCGATLNGYVGDAALTVCVGKCPSHITELVETTAQALYKAIEQAGCGKRLGDVSNAIQLVGEQKGYGIVTDFCGHGLGTKLHEPPQVYNKGTPHTGPLITAGWTIAIEPMFTLGSGKVRVKTDGWTVVTEDAKPSAHFEHSIAVLEDKTVILTLP